MDELPVFEKKYCKFTKVFTHKLKNITMFKTGLIIVILSVFILNGCTQSKEKTVIKIQLSEVEYLYASTNYTKDSSFLTAYQLAQKSYNGQNEEFIDVLMKNLLNIDPNLKLAALYGTFELKDKINYNSGNEEVITVLKKEVKLAKEQTMQVLKKRLESAFMPNSFLAKITDNTEVFVTEMPEKDMYSITINKKLDKTRFTKLLEARSDFGFWETYDISEIWQFLSAANTKLKEVLGQENKVTKNITGKEKAKPENKNLLSNSSDKDTLELKRDNPLFYILSPSRDHNGNLQKGCIVGASKMMDTSLVNKYLTMPEIKDLLPRNLKLLWEGRPLEVDKEYIQLVAIKVTSRDGLPIMNGDCIVEAQAPESNYRPVISIKMNAEGARIWSRITRDNVGKQIAIVINSVVYSCPFVNSEIKDGNSEISGNFATEEANDLASLLNAGIMPKVSVKVIGMNSN
jgi:SecD/SecF fusion protein